MNKQLQESIADLINKSLSVFDKAGTFLEEKLPDFLYQLFLWHGIYNFVLMILSIFLLIIIFCFYKISSNIVNAEGFAFWVGNHKADPSLGLLKVIVMFITSIPLLMIALALFNIKWLQIWIAPKVFLIEYATEIIK